jgi:hypothetical protein
MKSKLDKYFELDKAQNKFICQVLLSSGSNNKCLAKISNTGNTSARTNHLKSMHKHLNFDSFESIDSPTNSPIKKMLLDNEPNDVNSVRYATLNDAVLNFYKSIHFSKIRIKI